MNDDQLLLANAYLDDDVDDAARAQAEADPDVMTEVARLRRTREALRDVDGPDPARREQALAAAMAAFGDRPAPAPAPTAPVPLPQRPRRAWWGGALAAAAAVVVIAGGAVALRGGGGGGDDDSAAVATQARTESDAESTLDQRAAASEAPAAADEAGGTEATAPAPSRGDDAATAAPSPQVADLRPELATPEDLAAYARVAADAAAPSDAPTCTVAGTFVGLASYAGTPVEVFAEGRLVTAVDAATCEVVERVGP